MSMALSWTLWRCIIPALGLEWTDKTIQQHHSRRHSTVPLAVERGKKAIMRRKKKIDQTGKSVGRRNR